MRNGLGCCCDVCVICYSLALELDQTLDIGADNMKFAIKINMGDGWLYVTENHCEDQPTVKLFDSFEQADQHANTWRLDGKHNNVIVEEYFEVESPDPSERSWYYDGFGIKRKRHET